MECKNLKKGFTIIELVITIGVFAIVGTLVTGLVIMASNFTAEQNDISHSMREIDDAKDIIVEWFSKFDRASTTDILVNDDKNVISIEDVETINKLEFSNKKIVITEQEKDNDLVILKTSILEYIIQIKFLEITNNKVIKCTFVLANEKEFSFLMNKRSE